jgi:DNA-binding IclR family transcriptional regulator
VKPEAGCIEDGPASSLMRGLRVLECFGQQKSHRYTLSELARILSMPKSSIYRVLKTLSQMDYLRYEEHSKHYYLGVRVLSLGFALLEGMELREIARPYMEKLSHECNKTVNLAVLDRDEMVYVERISVRSIRSYNISLGTRLPPWNSAIGKAVMAHLEASIIAQMIKKAKKDGLFTENKRRFMKTLADVRENGFAESNQEQRPGILAIAVPIYSSKGVTAAINLVTEVEDMSFDVLKRDYTLKLMKVGNQMSEALGYRH